MNIWFQMLKDAPATLQRLIARSNRISLPRGASLDIRLERLRLSLCHAATVRATYFAMAKDEQAALQQLRHIRGGLSPSDLAARFGSIRPWSQIAADITPQSLSERLILHGFLLPRPASHRHPARFLLPPEVRAWLPRPLQLHEFGPAPQPPLAPALHAARIILLACAEHPLPLRQDGQLRVESLRLLSAHLASLEQTETVALCHFVLPLLIDLGLLAPHGADAALAPAGARFLALPSDEQLARLRKAWIGVPRVEDWIRPHLVDQRGIDWPLLRRRLWSWAAALPAGRLLDPNTLHDALTDAFGPLADAHTHGWRRVDRVPWWPRRARAIWDAALRGPLSWLGAVAWANAGDRPCCFATPLAHADLADADESSLYGRSIERPYDDRADLADARNESSLYGRSIERPYDDRAVLADTLNESSLYGRSIERPYDRRTDLADARDESSLYGRSIERPYDRRADLADARDESSLYGRSIERPYHDRDESSLCGRSIERAHNQSPAGAWRYGAPGDIHIPHAALSAAVLRLLPYAQWYSADAETTTYQISARSLGSAVRDGFSIDALATLLERQAGRLPQDWQDWLRPSASVRIVYGAVVTSDEPSALDRAARRRGVRRYLHHLAPGIALADPKRVETLSRVLGRLDLAVEQRGAPEIARPQALSAAECALLLAATDCYRHHAEGGVAPDSLAQLEQRLRAALPFEQRLAPGVCTPAQAHPPDIPIQIVGPLITDLSLSGRLNVPDAPATEASPDQKVCQAGQVVSAPREPAMARTSQRRALGAIGEALQALRLALIVSVSVLPATLWRRHVPNPQSSPAPATLPASLDPPAPFAEQAIALPGESPGEFDRAPIAAYLPTLHQAIERRQPLKIGYQAAEGPPSQRLIRPLRLESHGDNWYLHAYCTLRQAERVFRLDRITSVQVVRLVRRRGRPRREQQPQQGAAMRPARPRPRTPRASFFAPPPAPPPGSPLVRVWLAD